MLTATLTFEKPLVITACKTIHVEILANTSSSAKERSTYIVMLELASDILSDSKNVYGNFPIRGTKVTVVNMADRRSCYALAAKEETTKVRSAARAECRRK